MFTKADAPSASEDAAPATTMSPEFQTAAALVIVGVTIAWFIVRAIAKRNSPGCGTDCGAVSPSMRKLQAKLRRAAK